MECRIYSSEYDAWCGACHGCVFRVFGKRFERTEDESKENVLVPFINDIQGPLMHMPVTADKEAWTNRVTAGFYGKNSVIGMPREEWMDIYGKS